MHIHSLAMCGGHGETLVLAEWEDDRLAERDLHVFLLIIELFPIHAVRTDTFVSTIYSQHGGMLSTSYRVQFPRKIFWFSSKRRSIRGTRSAESREAFFLFSLR